MKTFTVIKTRRGRDTVTTGTIPELLDYFGYTLECGKSWEHEKGNKKININPKGIKSLVTNLNNNLTVSNLAVLTQRNLPTFFLPHKKHPQPILVALSKIHRKYKYSLVD